LSTVHIVTHWSGSGGIEAYLNNQLASFSALTLLVVVVVVVVVVPTTAVAVRVF